MQYVVLVLFNPSHVDDRIVAWLFELAGGALADFENTCIPKSQREAAFTIAALHQWEMELDDDACIDAAETVSDQMRTSSHSSNIPFQQWISETLEPVHVGGPLPSVSSSFLVLSLSIFPWMRVWRFPVGFVSVASSLASWRALSAAEILPLIVSRESLSVKS